MQVSPKVDIFQSSGVRIGQVFEIPSTRAGSVIFVVVLLLMLPLPSVDCVMFTLRSFGGACLGEEWWNLNLPSSYSTEH